MDERFVGLSLIVLGLLMIAVGILIYSIPVKEWRENPLIVFPLKKNGILIGFSPILFLILLVIYLLLFLYSR